MQKYHLTSSGKPEKCKASIRNCPLGGENIHFNTLQEAKNHSESILSKKNNILRSSRQDKEKKYKYINEDDYTTRSLNIPEGYKTYLSNDKKIEYAKDAMELIAKKYNLTPIASSIVGSSLRGNDRPDSDVDVLVLVLDKCKAKSFNTETFDGKVESLSNFTRKLDTSVPYMEFSLSPFMVIDKKYERYIASQKFFTTQSIKHADKFVEHALGRMKTGNEKKLEQITTGILYMFKNKQVTAPRSIFENPIKIKDKHTFLKELYKKDNL